MGWYLCKFYLKDAIYWETGRYANEEDAWWVPLKICDVTRGTLCSVPNELRVILINFLNLLFLSHFCPFLDFIRFSFSLFHSLSPKFSGKLSLSLLFYTMLGVRFTHLPSIKNSSLSSFNDDRRGNAVSFSLRKDSRASSGTAPFHSFNPRVSRDWWFSLKVHCSCLKEMLCSVFYDLVMFKIKKFDHCRSVLLLFWFLCGMILYLHFWHWLCEFLREDLCSEAIFWFWIFFASYNSIW